MAHLVDVGELIDRLHTELSEARKFEPKLADNHLHVQAMRLRVALKIEALTRFVEASLPSNLRAELRAELDDVARLTAALVDLNDTPHGHPMFAPTLPASCRPRDHREMHMLQAAASAAVSILISEKTHTEVAARQEVARHIFVLGHNRLGSITASTVKKWRSAVTSDMQDEFRRRFYETCVQCWQTRQPKPTPACFIANMLSEAKTKVLESVPGD